MVSLVVGAMALSGAAVLLIGLSGHHASLADAAVRQDRQRNAERVVRQVLAAALSRPDGSPALSGTGEQIRVHTLCETGRGESRPCSVALLIVPVDATDSAAVLQMTQPSTPTLALMKLSAGGRFLYLSDPARGGEWATRWEEWLPPFAVGLVVDGDTLLWPMRRDV